MNTTDYADCVDSKQGFFKLSKSLGLFRLALARRRQTSPLLILCYHGLSTLDEHRWNPELYITRDLFRQRLETIDRLGYKILPLVQALHLVAEGELKRPSVALTFDDGWYDFYSQAWPVLKQMGLPATVYQTTYYTQFNRPVFDPAVSYLFWKSQGRSIVDPFVTGRESPVRIHSPRVAAQLATAWRSRIESQNLNGLQKDDALERLAYGLGIDYRAFVESRRLHLMNTAEIATVSRTGIDVQLHTHSHRMPREKDRFLREVNRNRYFLEMATGKPAVHFCYPNGWHRPELSQWLAEAGVQTATTCDPGTVSRHTSPMYLPRMTDSSCVSNLRFESWLTGVGLIAPAIKRWLTGDACSPSRSQGALAILQSPIDSDAEIADPKPEPVRAHRAGAGR